jgi:hypothetical protein
MTMAFIRPSYHAGGRARSRFARRCVSRFAAHMPHVSSVKRTGSWPNLTES